jgi:hypothetical protein
VKFIKSISSFIIICFAFNSCEEIPKFKQVQHLNVDENDTTLNSPPPIDFVDQNRLLTSKKELQKEIKTPREQSVILSTTQPTKPKQPSFSKELLTAVKNWSRIPKSVFPTKPVTCNLTVLLEAKTSSGEVIAKSQISANSEVQVLGTKGRTLIVAHLKNPKLRGEIDIDQTDFKELLAYRFELNKQKRLELAKSTELEKKPYSKTALPPPTPKVSEEIPDPLDFGHGRFCICKECREKRLARTGSLKTGFGLEP